MEPFRRLVWSIFDSAPFRFVRVILAYAISYPLLICLLYLVVLVERYKLLRVERCSFWGNPEFLEVCGNAMILLQSLDPGLYQAVTRDNKYRCFYLPKHLMHSDMWGILSIDDSCLGWREYGVIARLLLIYSVHEGSNWNAWNYASKSKAAAIAEERKVNVRAWMKRHNFPPELVNAVG